MKKINIFSSLVLFFVFFFTMFVFNASAETNNWVQVGNPGFSEGGYSVPSIVFDQNNVPYIPYVYGNKAYIVRFNGSSWEIVGGKEIYSENAVISIMLTFDKNNTPYVAFNGFGKDSYKMFVMKFTGSSWENVNVGDITKDINGYPSIGFDKNNVLYLSYVYIESIEKAEDPKNIKNAFAKLNGNKWEEVSDIETIAKGNFCISLNLDNNDIPYLSCIPGEGEGNSVIYKLNNTKWEPITSLKTMGLGLNNIIYFDSQNSLYYALIDDAGISIFKVRGGNSEKISSLTSLERLISVPAITLDKKDNLYLLYSTYSKDENITTTISKFNGSSWDKVESPNIYGYNSGIFADNNGIIYLVYQDGNFESKMSVVKYGDFPLSTYKSPVGKQVNVNSKNCLSGEKFDISTGKPCPSKTTKITNHFIFTKSLKLGSNNNDTTEVNQLQKFLNTHGFIIAKTGNYSPGKESKYFGTVVKNALIKFQKKYGLTPDGSFGAKTRAQVNEILEMENSY